MKNVSPESVGISSEAVCDFVEFIEGCNLRTHSILLMRGDDLFAEMYYAPFNKDRTHRMYSVTKCFVSVAIGLLEEDGVISLDDKIIDYFPEKIDGEIHEWLKNQTIRDMLKMTTSGNPSNWFDSEDRDRVHLYLNKNNIRPSNTIWEYDSPGSQLMCSLVEKVTGKRLFDFLNERIFRHLGCFNTARLLKIPGGDSWGDSSMLCTPRDLITFARFVMNRGVWQGKRLMNEEYLKKATTSQSMNMIRGHKGVFHYGYGYQFWMCDGGFAFVGMGDQLAVCMPEKDIIFVCNSDNQGNPAEYEILVSAFLNLIVKKAKDTPIPENPAAKSRLDEISHNRKLFAISGDATSPLAKKIDGVVYECQPNPLEMYDFCFTFDRMGGGVLKYHNKNGEMILPFRLNENAFGKFPELGYSKEVGGERTTDGHRYDCATSAAFFDDNKIMVCVQIIDDYFGNASLLFAFRDEWAVIRAEKNAENFLWKYHGQALAKIK